MLGREFGTRPDLEVWFSQTMGYGNVWIKFGLEFSSWLIWTDLEFDSRPIQKFKRSRIWLKTGFENMIWIVRDWLMENLNGLKFGIRSGEVIWFKID